jgi:hypothetical protein
VEAARSTQSSRVAACAKKVDGLRVTDAGGIDAVVAVLAGSATRARRRSSLRAFCCQPDGGFGFGRAPRRASFDLWRRCRSRARRRSVEAKPVTDSAAARARNASL